MIVEIGHFALVLALAAALAQTIVPFWGARVGDRGLMGVGRSAALTQLGLIAIACNLLQGYGERGNGVLVLLILPVILAIAFFLSRSRVSRWVTLVRKNAMARSGQLPTTNPMPTGMIPTQRIDPGGRHGRR